MLSPPSGASVVITLARSPEPEVVITVTTQDTSDEVGSGRPGTKQFQDTPPRHRTQTKHLFLHYYKKKGNSKDNANVIKFCHKKILKNI